MSNVTKVQFGADPAPETATETRSIANRSQGTSRWSSINGVETSEVAASGKNASASAAGSDPSLSKGIIATAHDSWRSFVPAHEIDPKTTRLKVGNMTTTVEVAARAGLITQRGGQWVEAGGSDGGDGSDPKDPAPAPKAPEDPEDPEDDNEPVTRQDDATEASLTDALTNAPDETMGAALAYIQAGGEMPPAAVEALASRLGIEPSAAAERVTQATQGYTAEANKALAATFGDELAGEIFDWARDHQRDKLNAAAREHFSTGKPRYESLGRDFVVHLARTDPERIVAGLLNGGAAEARLTNDGKVVFKEKKGGVEREFVSSVLSGHIYGKKRK